MMLSMNELPRYDPEQTYQWNYDHAPEVFDVPVCSIPGDWQFCGLPVASPLGIPAGPLLNGKWCLYYAHLGFDVLTYKTVRSTARECFPQPNLQPVHCKAMHGDEGTVMASPTMKGSWAVSFGMPSQSPRVWRADVERTKANLPPGKLLSVSVVGTVQQGWSIQDLADDYACCARWALESGADCIETNFSCPNVTTCDGQLFQRPDDARRIAETVRTAIGDAPYIAKIGHIRSEAEAAALLRSLSASTDALAMTNSISASVVQSDNRELYAGQRRGICGDATRAASLQQIGMFARLIREQGLALQLIGVGGVGITEHVRQYLSTGAQAVHLATAAMINPASGLEIRLGMAGMSRPS